MVLGLLFVPNIICFDFKLCLGSEMHFCRRERKTLPTRPGLSTSHKTASSRWGLPLSFKSYLMRETALWWGPAVPGQVKTVPLESDQSPGTRHDIQVESALGPRENELV